MTTAQSQEHSRQQEILNMDETQSTTCRGGGSGHITYYRRITDVLQTVCQ